MVVREPTPRDAEAMARVHVRAWQVGYADRLPAAFLRELEAGIDRRVDGWRTRLESDPTGLLVGSLPDGSGEVQGICSFGESRDGDAPSGFGEVHMLNLDPGAWGSGLASSLLAAAESRLAELFRGAYLWVLDNNHRAQRFYRRHGWEADGGRKNADVGGLTVTELRYTVEWSAPADGTGGTPSSDRADPVH